MEYRSRVIDDELADLVEDVPAIAVVGPKAIGKTESARRLAGEVIDLADVDQRAVVRSGRREALAAARAPILLDEWQHDPDVWEAMRREIDADPSPGRFLLTGSANPRDVRIHSGAGRVVRLRMRPMSLVERGVAAPTVSLSALWRGDHVIAGESDVTVATYVDEILDSGFPAIRFARKRARPRLIAGYVDSALEHEVPELGFVPKRPASLAQWLRAYAAASSTVTTYESIAAAVPDDQRPTRTTVVAYRDVLSHLWLLDQVPAFALSRNRLGALGKMPKHQLADPALVGALLQLRPESLLDNTADREHSGLRDGPLVGHLFESLATLCIRVYAQPLDLDVAHIRTARGEREVDLVVHSPDGRALAIEVKFAATPSDRDVRHLHWLGERLGDDLVDKIVLTTGKRAYRRADGVAVVPLALLGP